MTSKIKVDNINKVSDDSNIIKKCGTTTTIGSGASNPIVVDGSAVTIGRCGGTVALASGATQTGFGRTGTVDWQTSSIKTATFTAESGKGYFCNTTGGTFEVDLPAGSAGAIVSIQDYNNTFDSNALTVDPNGSEKINGGEAGGSLLLSDEGQGLTLVYIDSTVGWRSIHENEFSSQGLNPAYITATGGTITTVCTNFKVHTFTSPGTFSVSQGNGALAQVDYMVVAGGGGGGGGEGTGGGGAGGYRESPGSVSGCYSVSPIAGGSAVVMSPGCFSITVGAGGAGANDSSPNLGTNGTNSIFRTITSAGGGGGGGGGGSPVPCGTGSDGGSGGGGGGRESRAGGSGNTPSTSPAQGFDGGTATSATGPTNDSGGGGGGATALGVGGVSNGPGGNGGAGATSSINATPTTRAGGGGGASQAGSGGTGGPGGGGAGSNSSGGAVTNGTDNTGGGGGGKGYPSGTGANGGSGIVIIRYRFQA
jgi:hypothetical protein